MKFPFVNLQYAQMVHTSGRNAFSSQLTNFPDDLYNINSVQDENTYHSTFNLQYAQKVPSERREHHQLSTDEQPHRGHTQCRPSEPAHFPTDSHKTIALPSVRRHRSST
jgi:hypothetical protein